MSLNSPTEVRQMFESIARRYDLLNRLCSLGLDQGWRGRLVASLSPPPGSRILDLASGSGDVTALLRSRFPGCHVVGLDCATSMLARARAKMGIGETASPVNGGRARVGLVQGWGEMLPFAGASFSAVTCAFGVRNFRPMESVLAEVDRVLEPGGQLAILEFAMPRRKPWSWLYRFYLEAVVPRLGAALSSGPAYSYLDQSIREFLSPDELCRILSQAGFSRARSEILAGGAVALTRARKGDR